MKNPVSDMHAEKALIGAALIDPVVLDQVNIMPEQFFDRRLGRTWTAMLALRLDGVEIDEVTVVDRAGAGIDVTLLGECAIATPTAQNAAHYAEIVRRHALTRQVLIAASEIVARAQEGVIDGADLLDEALAKITRIDTGMPSKARPIADVIRARIKQLDVLAEARSRGEHVRTGLPIGLWKLEQVIGGIQPGMPTVLCGRPGMGKSAVAMAITAAVNEAGHGVHVFSLEDLEESYADRLISRESRVPSTSIRTLDLDRGAWARIAGSLPALVKRTGWLYEDVSAASAEDVVRAVRRERHKNNTRLAVVDYLQKLVPPPRCKTRNDELRIMMDIFARAAKADGIAYLILSQLNREIEKRKDKRPVISDLRESGSIEEHAKLILGMYRGTVYGEPQSGIDWDSDTERMPSEAEWQERADIIVMKQNSGPSPVQVRMKWHGPTTRIYDPT